MFKQVYTFLLMELGVYVYHRFIHIVKFKFHKEHHNSNDKIIKDDVVSSIVILTNLFIWKLMYPSFLCTVTYLLHFISTNLVHHMIHSHYLPKSRIINYYRHVHHIHHKYPNCNYSSVTPMPDLLFGTMRFE